MQIKNIVAAACGAAIIAVSSPGLRAQTMTTTAEKIRKLNIMLMVSSLRCRHGPDNFLPAYHRFSQTHLNALNNAHREMNANMTARYGAAGGKKRMDRVSVSMANEYGQGHPTMNCKELGEMTSDLASSSGQAPLVAAAERVLLAHHD